MFRIIGLALLLAGCASSSGVFAIGGDTYRASSTAITSFGGSATAKGDAYRQATDYCTRMGKHMQLVDQQQDAQFTGASVDVTFRCDS
jgi:hypothetical protein